MIAIVSSIHDIYERSAAPALLQLPLLPPPVCFIQAVISLQDGHGQAVRERLATVNNQPAMQIMVQNFYRTNLHLQFSTYGISLQLSLTELTLALVCDLSKE